MILFTFVRHGCTQWNASLRFQGQTDVPLNDEGRAQARALAALLRDESFDVAVSSDLSRAYDTARSIVGRRHVERDPRWREFAFGQWEGLTWQEICRRWPEIAEQQWTSAKLYHPPGGESFDAVRARIAAALGELRAGGYANVLVVTHAGPLHAVLETFFADRRGEMAEALSARFSPGSVTRIALESNTPSLVTLNDVAHLDGARALWE